MAVKDVLILLIPLRLRLRLRRIRMVRSLLRRVWGGAKAIPYFDTGWTLHFDGYRNLGLTPITLVTQEFKERRVAEHLFRHQPPAVVWDIGANIGLWTMFLAAHCPPGTEIRCFEPDQVNLSLLRLNQTSNQLSHWVIRPVGISNREGSSVFFSDPVTGSTGSIEEEQDFIGFHYAAARCKTTIELTTMDAEVARGAPPPDFVKLDVEGHELPALLGGKRLLREHRPLVLFECTQHRQEIAAFLREVDYVLYDLQGRLIDLPQSYSIAAPRERVLPWPGADPLEPRPRVPASEPSSPRAPM